MPLAAGGAPFDIANCAVLCRSCNSTNGASEPDRGYPHADPAAPEDRAAHINPGPFSVRSRGWPRSRSSGHSGRPVAPVGQPGAGRHRPRGPGLFAKTRPRAYGVAQCHSPEG
ncbi:MAG: hypothetical protein H0U52_01110 [Chloroflexi bacterium]|nr:hypothetical protein [Chloroflexota bacterium]